jgi:hypothetical protein
MLPDTGQYKARSGNCPARVNNDCVAWWIAFMITFAVDSGFLGHKVMHGIGIETDVFLRAYLSITFSCLTRF